MNITKGIFLFLALYAFLCAVGLVFVKTNKEEATKISNIISGASFYQYKWFKYFGAIICFFIGVVSVIQVFK